MSENLNCILTEHPSQECKVEKKDDGPSFNQHTIKKRIVMSFVHGVFINFIVCSRSRTARWGGSDTRRSLPVTSLSAPSSLIRKNAHTHFSELKLIFPSTLLSNGKTGTILNFICNKKQPTEMGISLCFANHHQCSSVASNRFNFF